MSQSRYESFIDILKQEKSALWIFLLYTVLITILWHLFDLKTWVLELQNTVWPWYMGLSFSFLYVIRGFFYFPSLYFIIVASLLFSFPFGALYYLIGVYTSAFLSYQIGHHVRKGEHFPKLLEFVEQPLIAKKIKKNGLKAVFWFHLTGISLDIPNYLSGYLHLPRLKFMTVIIVANALTSALYFTLFYLGVFNLMEWL